jgi:small multidrug resistance pump
VSWLFLAGAILAEVAATLSLKVASGGRVRWYPVVVAGYVSAFVLLTLALDRGLGLGVAYGIWSAVGVALTALLSRPLFGEPLSPTMLAGVGLIIVGVLLVELGAATP